MASTPRTKAPPRIRRIQTASILLLLVAGTINYMDRSCLAIANTTVRGDLGFSGTRMGILLSVFSIAYAFAQLPAGPLLDRFGSRLLMGAGVMLWSLVQGATGFVTGFRSFVTARAALALGEAPYVISTVKTTRDWFSPSDRAGPLGVMNAGTPLAQAIAPPILTVLMLHFGWRGMFIAIAIPGVLLAIAWYAFYRDRAEVALDPAEIAYLEEDGGSSTEEGISFAAWRRLFRSRTMWGMMLGFGGVNYTAWVYISWMPAYLEQAHHVSIAATGMLAGIPFVFGAAGMVLSGWIADRMVRGGFGVARTHKTLLVSGLMLSAGCTLGLLYTSTVAGAVTAISMALFFIYLAGISGWGLVQAMAPASLVGSVASIQNFGSFICASAGPVLVGWLLDRTHSFRIALAICALVTLLGALSYLFVVRNPILIESGRPVAVEG